MTYRFLSMSFKLNVSDVSNF